MTGTTQQGKKRILVKAVTVALAVAALAAPAGLASGRSPDTNDAALAAHAAVQADGWLQNAIEANLSVADGRSADTLDAVSASRGSVQADGWLQNAIEENLTVADGRSVDTLDAASSVQAASLDGRSADTLDARDGNLGLILDGRSPDTRFASVLTHEPIVTVGSTGFDWNDAGIGFGTAFGIALMGFAIAFRLRRHGKPAMSVRQLSV